MERRVAEYGGVSSRVQVQAMIWRMRADLERLVAEAGPARMELPGAMGPWTIKDTVAHLASWRWWSVARLEAAGRNAVPVPPWGDDLDENREGDIDRINQQFYESSRDLTVAAVLCDSRETFDRLEAAVLDLSEADLFATGRYAWLGDYPAAAIVVHSAQHLYQDHEPGIVAVLIRDSQG